MAAFFSPRALSSPVSASAFVCCSLSKLQRVAEADCHAAVIDDLIGIVILGCFIGLQATKYLAYTGVSSWRFIPAGLKTLQSRFCFFFCLAP